MPLDYRLIENFFVCRSGQIFEDPSDIETLGAKRCNSRTEKILVRQERVVGSRGKVIDWLRIF